MKITPKVTADEARAAYHALIANADTLAAFINENFHDLQKGRPIELGRSDATLTCLKAVATSLQNPFMRLCLHVEQDSKLARMRTRANTLKATMT